MPLQQYIINDIKPLNINDKISDLKMMFNDIYQFQSMSKLFSTLLMNLNV